MFSVQLSLHTHLKLDTCFYELIYSEQSIVPPPKIFTIPSETPCIYMYIYFMLYIWNIIATERYADGFEK